MTKVWGMLCLAGLLISLYLGVSFLVPKQGKIILTFGIITRTCLLNGESET